MSSGRYREYDALTSSGEQWLGDVPSRWKAVRLKTLFQIRKQIAGKLGFDVLSVTQRGVKRKDLISGEGQLSMDYSKYQVVNPGEFVMNHMDLLTGFVDISPFHGVTSPDYRVFIPRPESEIHARFYLYIFQLCYLNKIFFPLGQGSAQLGRWRLPRQEFEGFILPTPPLEEQTQIAKFLDYETAKIDALIEKQQQLIALLKEKRQAVISHAVTKGLDPNAPMKDSGVEWLGQVPAHWMTVKLYNLTSRIGDGLHGTPQYADDTGLFFVNGNNLENGHLRLGASAREVPRVEFERHKVPLNESTVLLSINGTIGKVALYRGEPVILGKSAAYINCLDRLAPPFLRWFFETSSARRYYELVSTGTTISNLSLDSIRQLRIGCPSIQEQQEIVAFCGVQRAKYDGLIMTASAMAEALQERRTALISAAVTGKIDVRAWTPPPGAAPSSTPPNQEQVA